jgi:broad specificity phosphatase PhoE
VPATNVQHRHGARLDAADANWHLTSPAPYDPPLTYGGWNQAKALGSRIAHILSSRTAQTNAKLDCATGTRNGGAPGTQKKPKKQKVVIHSSPFLRCLQTSVAISAGMAQSLELPEPKKSKARGRSAKSEGNSPYTAEDYSVKALGLSTPDQVNIKTILRVDAFLGEWLSPDYFDHITPPPSSTMMVAAAKATLLRREQIEVYQPTTLKAGYFPGGWSKSSASRNIPSVAVVEDDMSVDAMSLMVPLRQQRSNSANRAGDRTSSVKPILSELRPSKAAYNPPVPAYAIAPSAPIPRGYCGHARDTCIDLDLLWDSMRFPQDWGDGGELGEEWSAMHRRFRKGLSKMIDWYSRHTPEYHPDREDPMSLDHELTDEDEDDNHDYELTVILVTHAAGCNALVGALTDEPVLHDFGLTSLSMAVRKEQDPTTTLSPNDTHSRSPISRRRTSIYCDMPEEYEMHILSSTNHLRAGAQATSAVALASPHLVPKIPTYASLSHIQQDRAVHEPQPSNNASLGSIRRPSLAAVQPLSLDMTSLPTSRSTSVGLWSRTSTLSTADDVPMISIGAPAQSRDASPITTTMERPPTRPVSPTSSEKGARDEEDEVPPLPSAVPTRSASQRGGLWGSGEARPQFYRPKRRWTVTEREDLREQ